MFNLPPNVEVTSTYSQVYTIFMVTDLSLHRFDSECNLMISSTLLLGVLFSKVEVAVTDERCVVYRVERCVLLALHRNLQSGDTFISADEF